MYPTTTPTAATDNCPVASPNHSKRPVEISWRIDLGHILTACVLIVGFGVQYGSLSTRLSVLELQAARAQQTSETLVNTLNGLKEAIARVEERMAEREKRYDAAQAAIARAGK